jgi:DNA replication initiation complex subunit (GINS family)
MGQMAETSDYYPRLLEQRRAEAATRGMAKMPPDFYSATQAFLSQLHQMLEKELKENPTSKKVEFIRSQYQRARAHARDVMDWRMGKIAALAVQAVAVGAEPENILPEERALFDGLVRELGGFRNRTNPFLEAMPVPQPPQAPEHPAKHGSAKGEPPAKAPPHSKSSQVVVRILTDGLPFVFGDGDTLELRKEDVAALPERVARILVEEAKRAEYVVVS